MIVIPGQLISAVTFPGVIVHEAAHQLFCRWSGVPVFSVCYFRIGNPAGFVLHAETDRFGAAFLIGIGPLFVNSLLCLLFCLPAVIPVWYLDAADPLSMLFAWLGLSIGMHAFPSPQDLQHVRQLARPAAKKGNLLAIVSLPLLALLSLANLGRFFWLDALWAVLVGMLVPLGLLRLFA